MVFDFANNKRLLPRVTITPGGRKFEGYKYFIKRLNKTNILFYLKNDF